MKIPVYSDDPTCCLAPANLAGHGFAGSPPRGELSGRKVGRKWRFSKEAIEEFMRGGVAERPGGHASERLTGSRG